MIETAADGTPSVTLAQVPDVEKPLHLRKKESEDFMKEHGISYTDGRLNWWELTICFRSSCEESQSFVFCERASFTQQRRNRHDMHFSCLDYFVFFVERKAKIPLQFWVSPLWQGFPRPGKDQATCIWTPSEGVDLRLRRLRQGFLRETGECRQFCWRAEKGPLFEKIKVSVPFLQALLSHQKVHKSNRNVITCDVCGVKLLADVPNSLKNHMTKHTGEKILARFKTEWTERPQRTRYDISWLFRVLSQTECVGWTVNSSRVLIELLRMVSF